MLIFPQYFSFILIFSIMYCFFFRKLEKENNKIEENKNIIDEDYEIV
jgi:preprotein translocase subunit YajC